MTIQTAEVMLYSLALACFLGTAWIRWGRVAFLRWRLRRALAAWRAGTRHVVWMIKSPTLPLPPGAVWLHSSGTDFGDFARLSVPGPVMVRKLTDTKCCCDHCTKMLAHLGVTP